MIDKGRSLPGSKIEFVVECIHGFSRPHTVLVEPDPQCPYCHGKGFWIGHSGSDGYSETCKCSFGECKDGFRRTLRDGEYILIEKEDGEWPDLGRMKTLIESTNGEITDMFDLRWIRSYMSSGKAVNTQQVLEVLSQMLGPNREEWAITCDHDWYRSVTAPPDVCLNCGITEDRG